MPYTEDRAAWFEGRGLWQHISETDWQDWVWQLKNRLTTVEQLERSGYVERRPNPHDRRSQLVYLTARGKRIPQVTHKAAAAVETRWARLSGPGELETLRGSLLDLLSRLTRE